MNEDERGITPPNVTAMTLQAHKAGWEVVIEQGNGDVIKTIELTSMERVQLAMLLDGSPGAGHAVHVEFVDFTRDTAVSDRN